MKKEVEEKITKGLTGYAKVMIKFFTIAIIVLIIGSVLMIGVAFIVIKNDNSSLKHKYDIVYKNDVVSLINENSELPVNYMVKYHEIMKEKYIRFDYNFTDLDSSYKFENKSEGVVLSYSNYPIGNKNDTTKYYITELEISKIKYNVLGITPGKTTMEDAIKILEENRFEEFKKEENRVLYKKDDFNIAIEINNTEKEEKTIDKVCILVTR